MMRWNWFCLSLNVSHSLDLNTGVKPVKKGPPDQRCSEKLRSLCWHLQLRSQGLSWLTFFFSAFWIVCDWQGVRTSFDNSRQSKALEGGLPWQSFREKRAPSLLSFFETTKPAQAHSCTRVKPSHFTHGKTGYRRRLEPTRHLKDWKLVLVIYMIHLIINII